MYKIAITGHTKGIGLAISELLSQKHKIRGYSKSNGNNIMRPAGIVKDIVEWDADIFINNAYAPEAQVRILYKLYEQWEHKPKLIINMGATSSDSINNFTRHGYNKDWTPYVSDKARLDWASLQLSNIYIPGKCAVTLLKPGLVETESSPIGADWALTTQAVAKMAETIVNVYPDIQIRNLSFDAGNYV